MVLFSEKYLKMVVNAQRGEDLKEPGPGGGIMLIGQPDINLAFLLRHLSSL